LANVPGPLLLARLFHTVGRRRMITLSYLVSGCYLAGFAQLFRTGALTAVTLTSAWCVIFFFASAGASAVHHDIDPALRQP
jgi:hypothetical protein